MLNKIDFSDPSFVMNRFLSLEKAVAALEAEVASLRINQHAHADFAQICPFCKGAGALFTSSNGFTDARCPSCGGSGKLQHV